MRPRRLTKRKTVRYIKLMMLIRRSGTDKLSLYNLRNRHSITIKKHLTYEVFTADLACKPKITPSHSWPSYSVFDSPVLISPPGPPYHAEIILIIWIARSERKSKKVYGQLTTFVCLAFMNWSLQCAWHMYWLQYCSYILSASQESTVSVTQPKLMTVPTITAVWWEYLAYRKGCFLLVTQVYTHIYVRAFYTKTSFIYMMILYKPLWNI